LEVGPLSLVGKGQRHWNDNNNHASTRHDRWQEKLAKIVSKYE